MDQTLQLAGRKFFITGGTGFVGRTLLDYLIDWHAATGQMFEITVLSRNPTEFLTRHSEYADKPWLRFVAGSLQALPKPELYTDVIHAAADTHLQGQGAKWIDQIVNGTAAVLDFAVKAGATRFLHTSSGAVYGPQPESMVDLSEDYSGAPLTSLPSSTYGQAKRVAEQLCTIYYHEHGLQTINARCFAFSGKHLPLDGPYALGNFIRDALNGDAIRVKGDGTALRSYLDGEDMACWLLTLLQRGTAGEAYNVGSNLAFTIKELAENVRDVLAPIKPVLIEHMSKNDGIRSKYIPCTKKAHAQGLQQNISLNASIKRIYLSLKP